MAEAQSSTRAKLETVVVGTDFSLQSSEAVRWIGERLAPEARLVLVHAVELPHLPGFLGGPFPHQDEIERTLRAGASERLETLRGSFAEGRALTQVRVGAPVRQLAEAVTESEADVVAVGRHGTQRGVWKLLGSTVVGLLDRCHVPVLVCHDPPDRPLETVLLAIDGSEASRTALAWGLAVAARRQAKLVVLHVINDWYARQVQRVGSQSQARVLLEAMEQRARTWLDELLAGEDLDAALPVVRSGDIVAEILAEAESSRADLLILGATGSGRHATRRLGSVARAVLHTVHCPVLVVRSAAGAEA